jgi:hypothetical protein
VDSHQEPLPRLLFAFGVMKIAVGFAICHRECQLVLGSIISVIGFSPVSADRLSPMGDVYFLARMRMQSRVTFFRRSLAFIVPFDCKLGTPSTPTLRAS